MPWTPAQMKAINAKRHGWNPPGKQPFEGVGKAKLDEMKSEGTRPPIKKKKGKGAGLSAQLAALKGK